MGFETSPVWRKRFRINRFVSWEARKCSTASFVGNSLGSSE